MTPLDGIRIADFTIHAAGPFCTHMLSQFGAECIKIESAKRPDTFRKPHAVYGRLGPATFDQVSANKLSVRINLKHPEGVSLAKRVVGISDLAAESFRPGVMKRLGLPYEALREVKKDIILLSLSSSGQSGPDSHYAGYAPLFGAWGGLGYLSGYQDGPPLEMRHVMDHSSGFHAVVAAMAALYQRRVTGQGQHVDVSAREVGIGLTADSLLLAAAGGVPRRLGNSHERMAPHGVYPTKEHDRWITLAIGTDDEWRAFLSVVKQQKVSSDSRFSSPVTRQQNQAELDDLVSEWTSHFDAEKLQNDLQRVGVPAHISWNSRDIVNDPHLATRKSIVKVTEPSGAIRHAVGAPAQFSKNKVNGITRGTPGLGQDEEYVFGQLLGLNASARHDLEDRQVIF